MLDVGACDRLLDELRTLASLGPEGRHVGDALTARLFSRLFDEDDTHVVEARAYVHDRQLVPLLLKFVEHVVDATVGSLHLQCTWDTVDSAFGILDNYCSGGAHSSTTLADIVAHDVLRRTLAVLQRCVEFDTRWVHRSSALESLLLLSGRLLKIDATLVEPELVCALMPHLSKLLCPLEHLTYKVCDYVKPPCIFAVRMAVQRYGLAVVPMQARPLFAEALQKTLRASFQAFQAQLDCMAVLGHLAEDAEAVALIEQALVVRRRLTASGTHIEPPGRQLAPT